MTEKRFEVYDDGFSKHIEDTYYTEDKHEHNLYDIWEMCRKVNELHEENQRLKQYQKKVLQNHLDGWRGVYNPIDESLVVEMNIVKSIAEDLGVDLE